MADIWVVATIDTETTVIKQMHAIFSSRSQAEKAEKLIQCHIGEKVIKIKSPVFKSYEGWYASSGK